MAIVNGIPGSGSMAALSASLSATLSDARRPAVVSALVRIAWSDPGSRPFLLPLIVRLAGGSVIVNKQTFQEKAEELGISVQFRYKGKFFAQYPHGADPDVVAEFSDDRTSLTVLPVTPAGEELVSALPS